LCMVRRRRTIILDGINAAYLEFMLTVINNS